VKFASDPLDRELLAEQDRSTEKEGEQQLIDELNRAMFWSGRVYPDDGGKSNPDRQHPQKECDIAIMF
jgi:hypothetical protein